MCQIRKGQFSLIYSLWFDVILESFLGTGMPETKKSDYLVSSLVQARHLCIVICLKQAKHRFSIYMQGMR